MINFKGFYDELLARERVEPTTLGNGVAFPHARTDHVKRLVLAVGRSVSGVNFETSGETIHFIFVIGTPRRMVTEYLALVGAMARLLRHDEDAGVNGDNAPTEGEKAAASYDLFRDTADVGLGVGVLGGKKKEAYP